MGYPEDHPNHHLTSICSGPKQRDIVPRNDGTHGVYQKPRLWSVVRLGARLCNDPQQAVFKHHEHCTQNVKKVKKFTRSSTRKKKTSHIQKMSKLGQNCYDETFKLSEEITKILTSACGFIIALSVNAFFQNIFSYIKVGGETLGLFLNAIISIILFLVLASVICIWLRPFLCSHVDCLASRTPKICTNDGKPADNSANKQAEGMSAPTEPA